MVQISSRGEILMILNSIKQRTIKADVPLNVNWFAKWITLVSLGKHLVCELLFKHVLSVSQTLNHFTQKMLPKGIASLLLLLFVVNHISTRDQSLPILFDFRRKERLTLPNGAKSQSIQVGYKMSCFTECVRALWCQSGNFKTTPEPNGLHICELLSSDRFTNGNSMIKDEAFDYFNFKVKQK